MPIVEIQIKRDIHQISCEEGEEEKVEKLALRFKEKIESLCSIFPKASEKTLYLMAGLMLIDENADLGFSAKQDSDDIETRNMLEQITNRVEGLIQALENTNCDVS